MMRSSVVLTIIGPDRTGLVETIAQAVAARGGNWVESRMARLAGHFAGILLVDVDPDQRGALEADLRDLASRGLRVTLEATEVDDAAPGDTRPLRFDLVGQDRPGIVRDIARVLAQHGVNVVGLETEVISAPMTGDPLFHARAGLHVPADESLEAVRDALEAIANDLMVDITFGDEG